VPRKARIKPEPRRAENHNVVTFPARTQPKNPAAVALGRLGGLKGGARRAEKLSSEEKIAIARQGGLARQAMARSKKAAGG
jgi:hypothetical protein